MKKEETVSKVQNYLNTFSDYRKIVEAQKGKKRFGVLDFFANNIGGRVFSGSIFGTVGLLLAAPLGIFALIPMAATGALGFFVPKIVEKINLKRMDGFGVKYTRHYLKEKACFWSGYHWIIQKKVSMAETDDEIADKDLNEFLETAKLAHKRYSEEALEFVREKIEKRTVMDEAKINKVLSNKGYSSSKKQAKVEKILAEHEKVVTPWFELNNEAKEFALNNTDCLKELDSNIQLVNDNNYFTNDNASYLRNKVYKSHNDIMRPVEFDTQELSDEPKNNQHVVKVVSKNNEKEEQENFDKIL